MVTLVNFLVVIVKTGKRKRMLFVRPEMCKAREHALRIFTIMQGNKLCVPFFILRQGCCCEVGAAHNHAVDIAAAEDIALGMKAGILFGPIHTQFDIRKGLELL